MSNIFRHNIGRPIASGEKFVRLRIIDKLFILRIKDQFPACAVRYYTKMPQGSRHMALQNIIVMAFPSPASDTIDEVFPSIVQFLCRKILV